jgi:putative redox protein
MAAAAPEVVVRGNAAGFSQSIRAGLHELASDEPLDQGGAGTGPSPYELLAAALGACTSMTLGMYARRKQWPLDDVQVRLRHSRIYAEDCADCDTKEGMLDRIDRDIELTGNLTPEQRARLLEIADQCPVHRTLTRGMQIHTRLV